MEALDIARWQFGITTVYHFFFVPLTIGLAFLVAVMQTAWYRTGEEYWLRLTKFYGKLFLINFILGVVTGLVQEFQFGMNWSAYSRFVGDVFGAPLAVEGLVAFFLESTFLGLWIFGWDRLPRRIHLACIWMAAIGTMLSAYFILAANSWMQHPVGFRYNEEAGRAELTDFAAVLTNKVTLVTFPHTMTAAFMTGAAFVAGIAMWHLVRRPGVDSVAFRSAARLGAWTLLVAGLGVVVSGDVQGKIMTEVQPMKMAAAEALYETEAPASFSILTIGSLDGKEEVFTISVPRLLSFLATGTWDGEVQGINNIQEEYEERFGPGDYAPNIPVTYWTFRLMMGTGMAAMAGAVIMLWVLRKGGGVDRPVWGGAWAARGALLLPFLPIMANSFGWIFTEMGRQPWVVFSLMQTAAGVSPSVGLGQVLTTMIGFTLLYGALAVVEVGLIVKYARAGLPEVHPVSDDDLFDPDSGKTLTFAY